MKLWGGRFTKSTNQLVDEYTASISFDQQLAKHDIEGSLAHVEMLQRCEIITIEEADQIKQGLETIAQKIDAGEVAWSEEQEDIHMNIEKLLMDEIGGVGGKLHTARSRNDQVVLDMRLYLREQLLELIEMLVQLQHALVIQAENHLETLMPGYTHLQRAQPVLLSHHFMAYVFMLQRDIERLMDSWKRINRSPLGAGALAGTSLPIDRQFVADVLGFEEITENSLDTVSDRDFVVEFLATASLGMMHLSRLCEELVLWSSVEFSFIELDDAFCTGSSMMPQKKNPDVAELVRGKSGRVYGHLIGLLTMLKGLPLAYNKDMQEDKEGMFDTIATWKGALELFAPMIRSMRVNEEAMKLAVQQDYSNATDFADYLVQKGMPFRESHAVAGQVVLYCIENKKYLLDLTLEDMQSFSNLIEADVFDVLQPERIIHARNIAGGTASCRVNDQMQIMKENMMKSKVWLGEKKATISAKRSVLLSDG